MLNKKSIELSLNFIVIIVLSIIIFGFGVRFIYMLSSQATDLQQLTISDLDEKIGNVVCEGSDRVCIGTDRKTIPRSKFDVFGVKILNIGNDLHFQITVTPSSPIGYKKDNSPISEPHLIVNPESRPITIPKNEEKTIGIGVKVPPNAVSGTYILNVEISTSIGPYVSTQKLYVNVP